MSFFTDALTIAAPLVGGLMGDGSVRARENNFAQNAENAHWFRVQQDRLDESYRIQRQHDTDQMREQFTNQFDWLVEGAQKAGFNPLTVLGRAATNLGGSGGVANMPLSQQQGDIGAKGRALSDSISAAASVLDPIEQERRRLENELMQKRIDQINSEDVRLGKLPTLRKTTGKVETTDPYAAGQEGPLIPPTDDRWPRITVWLPNGDKAFLDAGMAERYKIPHGALMSAGELAEIVGEVTGEVANLLQTDKVIENAFKAGIFRSAEGKQKKKIAKEETAKQRKKEGRESVRW